MKKTVLKIFILIGIISLPAFAGCTRDAGKKVVTCSENDLMWQDDANAKNLKKSFNEAITTCENLTLGGYSDWRLPNVNELLSIVDFAKTNSAIKSGFSNYESRVYLSSTTYKPEETLKAWLVSFGDGKTEPNKKAYDTWFRCVRGGR